MKLTDVTICYNNCSGLKKTLDSFLQQTFKDFQVIVVDGGSNDGTQELLAEYERLFKKMHIPFAYISEKDKGRYDAMNKGIARADGEWICFMNSGDVLADSNVLEEVFETNIDSFSKYAACDIVYGDNKRDYQGNMEYHKAGQNLEYIKKGLPFSHQSVFTKTTLFKERLYEQRFQLSGDYEWFLNAFLEGKKFGYIPICISVFDMEGVSSYKHYALYKEVLEIRKIHHVQDPLAVRIVKLLAWKIIEMIHLDNRKLLRINDSQEER